MTRLVFISRLAKVQDEGGHGLYLYSATETLGISREELIELWHECRLEDSQAAKLLETYLDRLTPDWREAR